VNNGLTNTDVYSLAVSGANLFAGTSGGVWRRPLQEMSVQTLSNEVPEQFSLEQNYPNPFNPVTKINYHLQAAGYTKLVVYDVLGHEVTKLVNEKQSAGTYQVEFDAKELPSGVYFYKLETDDFADVKRMMLVK
jgi:hypothetical protein